ncbi:MAG: hypothetical protein Q7K34_03405 [archaeon]|nr:hypothetical protein [archaeon]
MTFNVSLIQVNGSPKTVREAVISMLSNEWPLSAKQIISKGKKEFGFSVSNQAVYKAIKQLENEKIIKNEAKGYLLNPEWIEKTKEFSTELHRLYSSNGFEKHSGNSFTCSTLYESDLFLMNLALQNAPSEKNDSDPLILHWSHYWVPLLLSMEDYRKIKDALLKFRVYGLVKGNTVVDRWCHDFWVKQGFNTKQGIDVASTADLVVYRDMVVQIFYPPEIKKALDDFYSTPKQIQDLDIHYLFENIFQKKTSIQIITTQNAGLAKQLTQETMKFFEGETQ